MPAADMATLPLFAAAAAAAQEECTPLAASVQTDCRRPADVLPPDLAAIIQVLAGAVGKSRAVTAAEIAVRAGLLPDSSRTARSTHVRQVLSRHYLDLPWPLVGDPSAGYYQPETDQEVTRYLLDLRGRAEADLLRLQAYVSLLQRTRWHAHGPRHDAIESVLRHLQALH